MWPNIAIALALIALSVGLVLRNEHTWRRSQHSPLDEGERDYLCRRHARRMQVNIMLGLVGLSILLGIWITTPLAMAIYWLGVLALVVWIFLLALADIVSTRAYFARLGRHYSAQRATLEREIQRLERPRNNGKHEDD